MPKRIRYITFLLFFVASFAGYCATCNTTGSGLWANTSTWSCGHVPVCGDSVTILAGHTVSITSANYNSCVAGSNFILVIKGTLRFTTPGGLDISCFGRVQVFTGGSIFEAGGGGNSNYIKVCGSTWWNAAAGTYVGPGCMPATLPGCKGVLPIELTYFNGVACAESVCLDWETMYEKNNSHFEISRSLNGLDFIKLGTISSLTGGNSTNRLKYSYTDQTPLGGVNYYKLKQYDFDGSSKEFDVIEVRTDKTGRRGISLYPNPNNGEFYFDRPLNYDGEIKVRLVDALGLNAGEVTAEQNKGSVIFARTFAAPGFYQCIITIGSHQFQSRLILR